MRFRRADDDDDDPRYEAPCRFAVEALPGPLNGMLQLLRPDPREVDIGIAHWEWADRWAYTTTRLRWRIEPEPVTERIASRLGVWDAGVSSPTFRGVPVAIGSDGFPGVQFRGLATIEDLRWVSPAVGWSANPRNVLEPRVTFTLNGLDRYENLQRYYDA